ncbi:MAG: outer membrane beta-barrel protein [Alistipes sp.]|nr:outer membrane beta-barrel protein [Alistipes sp.]
MKIAIYVLLAVFTLSTTAASAQMKGDKFVGGDFGLGVTSNVLLGDSATAVEFGIQPNVGFFVADNFMLGFSLGYSVQGGDGATHTLMVGPKISYYVPLCDKLYYTPSVDAVFCYAATDGYGFPGFGLELNILGLEYRPTQRIGLSASLLSFDYVLLSRDGLSLHTISLGLSINPKVGVKLYF